MSEILSFGRAYQARHGIAAARARAQLMRRRTIDLQFQRDRLEYDQLLDRLGAQPDPWAQEIGRDLVGIDRSPSPYWDAFRRRPEDR